MRYLLDTHTLLWYATQPAMLSKRVTALLKDPGSRLYASAATSWEIATKYRLGKLPTAEHLLQGYESQLEKAEITILAITSEHARTAGAFPARHGDPFDRILAAQAFLDDLVLLSNDRQLDLFGAQRLW